SAYYAGGEYYTWAIEDKNSRTWKVMFDSSLLSQRKNDDGRTVGADGDYRCELVTPILRWNDIATLQGVVKAIVAAGGFVNKSCGLHVHIGGNELTAQGLRNLLNIVGSRENLFYEAFAVEEYRKDYCRPTNTIIIREFNELKPKTLEEAKEIWYNGRTSRAERRYDDSRYTICNLHAFFNKGTVEFRLFNGTLDTEEIAAAIHFSAALVDMAKRKSRTVYETFTDRPFERMSNFLGRLKLTGDEFKRTRHHILKHLMSDNAGQTAVA
ncbi:MAG: amidoligase family protein, partial [Selenomonadaceae bacterium]|nr:amidoligase family protein [Selenomonadaceae bacterium]